VSSPIETLNNAIYSLASLNPENKAATTLNEAWQVWFEGVRTELANSSWWLLVKPYWLGYAAARASAEHLSERTPPALDIEPTYWNLIRADASDAGEVAVHAAKAAGAAIVDVAKPTLFVVAAIGVGYLIWSLRK
jgi:hypothetical protein